tara:strand:+ start:759 stop:923 length:165 start_codon:yes stop_codon:yes gene_type:complete
MASMKGTRRSVFHSQAPTLRISASGFLAEDFFQDFDLLLKVIDGLMLLPVDLVS